MFFKYGVKRGLRKVTLFFLSWPLPLYVCNAAVRLVVVRAVEMSVTPNYYCYSSFVRYGHLDRGVVKPHKIEKARSSAHTQASMKRQFTALYELIFSNFTTITTVACGCTDTF